MSWLALLIRQTPRSGERSQARKNGFNFDGYTHAGHQAAEKIKAFSTVPMVALTASVMEDDYERAKSIHFDGYLRKPVLKADLIAELMRFLPYEIVEGTEVENNQPVLSIEEVRALPFVILELEKLTQTCEQISKTNNMTEIKKFADTVLLIGKRHSLSTIIGYASKMHTDIDGFDITAIKQSLKAFPKLLEQLSAYNGYV